MSYKIGDLVTCKIKLGAIVYNNDSDCDNRINLRIVGLYEHTYSSTEYVAYVPHYEIGTVKPSGKITLQLAKSHNIDKKFINEEFVYVRASMIVSLDGRPDGMACAKCKEFFDKATANQENGTLICTPCRFNRYR